MSAVNGIDQTFATLKEQGKAAFIPFITVGDPDLDATLAIVKELQEAGADIVELGVPYSDPLADGPVIQRASERALSGRMTTIIDCIRLARQAKEQGVTMPFILFTYYNPVLQLGYDRIFAEMEGSGIAGMIVPDLPLEENAELKAKAAEHGVHLIPLVAPTSKQRVERIVRQASGFVYCVSSLGVTGERSNFASNVDLFLDAVRAAASVPIAVGFGISTREQVEHFSKTCDGVIVGSAIVRKIEEQSEKLKDPARRAEGVKAVGDFVRSLTGR